MSADDKETEKRPSVLEKVREAAARDRSRKGGNVLALVPITVAVLMLALMMPRATAPEALPMPRADVGVLARIAADDDARARAAEATRLPSDVLLVGTALREMKRAEAKPGDDEAVADARRHLVSAIGQLAPRPGLEEDLRALRALQARRFLDALATWEARGEKTDELVELGGNFVERMADAGWVKDRRVLLGESQRRTMFKTVWNALVSADARPGMALALDEQRDLYAFYLEHPHVPDARREALLAQRAAAKTPELCARANAEEARQSELWRAEKIRKLGTIDPAYPTAYALGVAYYRAQRFDLSVDAFTAWLQQHPDGPYGLRAKNHLKAALSAGGVL